MTRAEIEGQYTTKDGIIRNPGKFQGEPIWAPAAYEWWGDGCPDLEGGNHEEGTNAWAAFKVDDDMRKEWGDTIGADTFALGIEETDQGFVYSQELTEAEYNALDA